MQTSFSEGNYLETKFSDRPHMPYWQQSGLTTPGTETDYDELSMNMSTRSCTSDSLMTPNDSPNSSIFWSGVDCVKPISPPTSIDYTRRHAQLRLERPFIGQPRDFKEKCVSVSLVVGRKGLASIQKEEVEVEFLEGQKELAGFSMQHLLSRDGNDAPAMFRSASIVSSTRGEVIVRSASQQQDTSHSLPLTPTQEHKFIAPMMVRKDSEQFMRLHSNGMLHTPESNRWDSDGESDGSLCDPFEAAVCGDAKMAIKKVLERKKGKIAGDFVGSAVAPTPLIGTQARRKKDLSCDICHITIRSRGTLALHKSKCSVKVQAHFYSKYRTERCSKHLS